MPTTKLLTTAALTLCSLSLLWVVKPRTPRARAVPAPGSGATEGAARRTLSDGTALEGGEPRASSSRDALEALQAAELPEAGFPSDRSHDDERVRPGLADFARGA